MRETSVSMDRRLQILDGGVNAIINVLSLPRKYF